MLALLLFGAWGYAVVYLHIFPYRTMIEVRDFFRGDPADHRSPLARLESELGYNPAAFAASSKRELLPADRLSPVRAAPDAGGVMPEIDGMTYFAAGGPTRYFVVFGSFAFLEQETNWGAIAIDSEGVVHRGWAIRPDRYEHLGAHIGLAVLGDGLVATNAHGVLSAYDWCGKKRWEAPWTPHPDGVRRDYDAVDGYDWHHDIMALDGQLHSFRGSAVMAVDGASGKIVSEIHAVDLIRWGWRDGLSLFEARRRISDTRNLSQETLPAQFGQDPFHFNKVDVLGVELAHLYPEFEAGDMLISLRELNLIVVVRPSTERIVWWRYGLTSAQHDATFVEGHIEVFDNNSFSIPPRPRIVRLDLGAHKAETVFDLSRWKMVMRYKGNFERRGDRLLTVDDDAGRAIAGRIDATIDFVFENGWRDPGGRVLNLQVRNATEIESETFARLEASCAG
jgi:hypothetical protein